jgi:RNA polymerase sigma-70 factor (ECF subfamily)
MNDQVGGNARRARFQALCQSLRPDLLRFAFWLSRDRALAEDVVQESMLRAWKAQDSLLNEGAAKPWLLTIVRREYARIFERRRQLDLSGPAVLTRLCRARRQLRAACGEDTALDPQE